MRTVKKPFAKAKVKCLVCHWNTEIPMEQYQVGEVIYPYAGGGNYGKCGRCGRDGLQVIEIPVPKIINPIGWHDI
jgi:hypothetical protein